MRRSPLTYIACCLMTAPLVGCVSPFNRSARMYQDVPAVESQSTHEKLSGKLAPPSAITGAQATARKPVVRNQNAGVRFGGVANASYDAPAKPMPVSGHASPIGTTVPNQYATQTQFTNPDVANKGNQAWSLPARVSPQQIRQQITGGAPNTYQPPKTAPTQPGTYQVAQAPPPAGYPGAPQFPGAQYSPPPNQYGQSPAAYGGSLPQQQPARPGLWSPLQNQPQQFQQPNPQQANQPPASNQMQGNPYGNQGVQPNGPPTSFASAAPSKLPISKAPSSQNNAPGGADSNWSSTVPNVSQPRVSQLSSPDPTILRSPAAGPPSATLSPSAPQGVIPQGAIPPGGVPQTVPQQPGTYGAPPIGGWPQAFGTPQAPGAPGGMVPPSEQFADVIVNVQETQTGKFMIGAAVNSDAGLTGQIVIDEQNFDWRRWPTSFDDFLSGQAFRGGGQRLRIEALPGDEVQRYMVQFSEPYLGGTRITFNLSGYYFDRRYFDWDENRLGVRTGLGYRISPDLSIAGGIRAERVRLTDPRVPVGTVPELDEALGTSELYSGNISLTHDTRDISFAPTQGHYFRFNYDQVFGSFDYGRGEIDWRRYFLVTERPDGSGRHVLGFSNRFSLSGSETPIYENFFAGGHATLRGFEFRGASPEVASVTVGGRMMFLGSVEYLFPITADDMLKGVVFCDYGTVEEDTSIDWNDFRVALGAGLRVSIAAMGPAPIALDFAVPVNREGTDDIQNFSFFVGVSR